MTVNLFIAGACKCGTTYLHDVLSQQKDILGADPKEPYFFELPESMRNEEAYHSKYFGAHTNENYLLDSRHRTMFFSWIPEALNTYNPNAKVIFILRNPIDRAFSHWWMWYSRKIIKTSFNKTVRNELKMINEKGSFMEVSPDEYYEYVQLNAYDKRLAYADANTIVESGHYYEQIQRFKTYFDAKNLLILDFNVLSQTSILQPILENFLGVTIAFDETKNRQNKGKRFKQVKSFVSPILPKSLKRFIKNSFYKKPKISKKTHDMLYEHYKPHNEKLHKELKLEFVKDWYKK